MRTIILFLAVVAVHFANAQDWQTLYQDDYLAGDIRPSWWGAGTQSFLIDKSDNSIWMIGSSQITHIDGNGVYERFDTDNNHPVLVDDNYYRSFCFANGKTYLLNEFTGLFSYDGMAWNLDYPFYNGVTLSTDNDTIWIGDNAPGTDVRKIYSSTFENLDFSTYGVKSKNGALWYNSSGYMFRYYSGTSGQFYNPDTCLLLGTATDYKFEPTSDSLFVATEGGLSIAYNDVFIDTITTNNTINMPPNKILEFEFDPLGNIWALFGTSTTDNTHLAYLDRSLMEWTHIYDNTNSPLDWSFKMTFEIDNMGNVWVPDGTKLDVLKMNPPTWLGNESIELTTFEVFPNPSDGVITIDVDKNTPVTEIVITDLNGKVLSSEAFTPTINIDLASGVYFVHLKNHNTHLATQKVVLK